jgi:flagellar hook-basal body complex protein FliE
MKIDDVGRPQLAGELAPAAAKPPGGAAPASFGAVLKDSLSEVNRLQEKADAAITALASGEKASLHDTMIAMEQASISFRLMMQVRNKIVEAYQEVMRIQV